MRKTNSADNFLIIENDTPFCDSAVCFKKSYKSLFFRIKLSKQGVSADLVLQNMPYLYTQSQKHTSGESISVENGFGILSAFSIASDVKLCVITEAE